MVSKFKNVISLIIAATACLSQISAQDYTDSALNGKSGAQLKNALRLVSRPLSLSSDSDMKNILRDIDSDENGNLIDRYSPEPISGSISSFVIDHILSPSWWKSTIPDYGDTISLDLHHCFLCHPEVPNLKRDYPPGLVITPTSVSEFWQVGYGQISGERVWMYTPAQKYRGDFARCVFYMVTLYPVKMWNGLGINIFSDNDYPTLNRYSTSLLLKWHAEDPVDDIERKRDQAIFRQQGNHNPFVTHPDLVDHIWGAKSQLPWNETSTEKPEITPPQVTYPDLRPSYLLTDTIYLHSPYIPTDATWTIDGTPQATLLVPASKLGNGTHQIRFTSPSMTGKLKITVK